MSKRIVAKEVKRNPNKFSRDMQTRLVVLVFLVLLAFVGLTWRLVMINRDNGEQYKQQVLSQQRYDSITIPYKRGEILDSKGTVLAVSEKVYNVILDAKALLEKEEYLAPTLEALSSQMGIDTSKVQSYLSSNPESQYYVLAKRLEYEQIAGFKELQSDKVNNPNIQGIWFEEEYKRTYPNNSMASDVIGFTTNDNIGSYGLEEYYNATLSGTTGREYGYLNMDSDLERTTIAAVDGNSIVTTIDANIQSIVEKHLKNFNEEYKDNAHPGNGANNAACIIMDVDSGEILAMASYPNFDLNDTRNTDALLGMSLLDENGKKTREYITSENVGTLDGDLLYTHYNALWKNFCISDTYEPGSVAKPFTVAAGIDSGSITGNETYNCNGFLHVGDYDIKCHNTYGDGLLSVGEAVERSCNVGMMYVGMAMGQDTFVKYQHIFNFGLKTNIDLAGEARTASLIYTADTIGPTELATNTFGQSFNTSMVQMITGFCSLINGGYYYEPHVVSKIVSPSGATVENIEPRLLKQTISNATSEKIKEFCNLVVSGEHGTGKTARPAGYMIGGKTGTAETLPRKNREYVVSFMGYAPADDPQIAIYVVVDRPNVQLQDDAKYATRIVRSILTEVLPYLNIFMTEELSDDERAELEALQIEIRTPVATPTPEGTDPDASPTPEGEESSEEAAPEATPVNEVWRSFAIDPATGYAIDPNTGNYVDPTTGAVIGGSFMGEESGVAVEPPTDSNPEDDDSPE